MRYPCRKRNPLTSVSGWRGGLPVDLRLDNLDSLGVWYKAANCGVHNSPVAPIRCDRSHLVVETKSDCERKSRFRAKRFRGEGLGVRVKG